jgi:hypothetical protein
VWFATSAVLALAPAALRPLRVLNELPFVYATEDHLPEFYVRAAEARGLGSSPASHTAWAILAHLSEETVVCAGVRSRTLYVS